MGDSDSSSSSDPDAPPPPPSAVCQQRIDQFLQVIHNSRDEAYAQMLLQRSGWQVEAAVAKHFQREAKALGMDVEVSERAPERIHVATWNIDGLDDKDRAARTEEVCRIIQERKIEVLQFFFFTFVYHSSCCLFRLCSCRRSSLRP